MTFDQMRAEAELLYESINSSNAPGFLPIEWGQFLTIGQRRVVLRILGEGVTKNAFNQLAIEYLIKSDNYTAFTVNAHFKNVDGTSARELNISPSAGKAFDARFFWVLDEYVTIASKSNIPVTRITYDFYRTNKDNPFRTPSADFGYWLLHYNNIPVFITDGTEITGYYIVGVYHPDNYPIGFQDHVDIPDDCVLNESIHSKIVEEAVTLARMSVTDPQGYQLALAEFSK